MKALKPKVKKKINHVAFLLDASGSMAGIQPAVRETLGKLMDGLSVESKRTGIETRVHIYSFGYSLRKHLSDVSPREASAFDYSSRNEGTALVDSTMELVGCLEEFTSTKEDVSILVYILTDGANTENGHHGPQLKKLLAGLNDDWTMAIMVPDEGCKAAAVSYGFPEDNIQIWETTTKGTEVVGMQVLNSTQSYYNMRATTAMKSTKQLFKFDELNKGDVKAALEVVNPGDYQTLLVRKYDDGREIKDFVEAWTKEPYRVGSAYYQLTKPEKVQAGKVLAVVDKQTGKMYSGVNARKFLGLPNAEIKVDAANLTKFDIFIQSHSTNRHLVADTQLIVFK